MFPDEEYYNIIINTHGITGKDMRFTDPRSINNHYISLIEDIETKELFKKITLATNSKPIKIFMISCFGKYAQQYLTELPEESILLTFSGNNSTQSMDMSFSTDHLIDHYRHAWDEITNTENYNPHSLISFLNEIYCFNQHKNAFDPRIGVHSKGGQVSVIKIGKYSKKYLDKNMKFSKIFEALFKNKVITQDHVEKLIENTKDVDFNIRKISPKINLLKTLKFLENNTTQELIDLLETKYYPPNSFVELDLQDVIGYKAAYDHFIKKFKYTQTPTEIKEKLNDLCFSYMPKTIEAYIKLIENNGQEEDRINFVNAREEEINKIYNQDFCKLYVEIENTYQESSDKNKMLSLFTSYFKLMHIINEIDLNKAVTGLINSNKKIFNAKYIVKTEIEEIENMIKGFVNLPTLEEKTLRNDKLIKELGSKYIDQIELNSTIFNLFYEILGENLNYVFEFKDLGRKAKEAISVYIKLNTIVNEHLKNNPNLLNNNTDSNPIIDSNNIKTSLKEAVSTFIDFEPTNYFKSVLKNANATYEPTTINHKISNHNI